MAAKQDWREGSHLAREVYPMPDFVEEALEERGLTETYGARPAYQQNDYIGWITRAKRPDTRQKRLDQMLEELEEGGVYMKMAWNGDNNSARDGPQAP
jgi:uncharacterized protein YdeI (YjbR/CyaY-like superfamily)